jgi:uncharacterized protein YndB with AHSA1/START domain
MSDDITLTITRVLDAPRELVFKAWADPEQCAKWCCPIGYEVTFRDADVKQGGNYRTGMSDGQTPEKIYSGNFLEVVPPEKLVFEHHWDDTDDYTYPHTTCTVELNDLDGKTEMIFTQVGFNVEPEKEGHNQGWNEIFDKLGDFVKGQQ